MTKRAKPELVDSHLAYQALDKAGGDRQTAWTQYILLHFRATGRLAPGCDMKDLQCWYALEATP